MTGKSKGSDQSDPAVQGSSSAPRRSRAWGWTGLAVGMGIVVMIAMVVQLFALVILLAAGSLTIVATVRLRRRRAMRTAADQYQPRYSNWIWVGIALSGLLVLPAVFYVPSQVDAIAYLAGAGRTATFFPVHYARDCSGSNCWTATAGVLATGRSGVEAHWPDKVPLGKPFRVRTPVWAWGSGRTLISGTSGAAGYLLGGLLFDLLAAFIILNTRPVLRHMWKLRADRRSMRRSNT